MVSKIKSVQLLYIFTTIIFIECEYKKTSLNENKKSVESTALKNIKTNAKVVDSLKYNNRVCGTDEEGNYIEGKIIIEGKNGIGILTGKDGNVIEIVFELENNNKLIATDIEGFHYNLKIK